MNLIFTFIKVMLKHLSHKRGTRCKWRLKAIKISHISYFPHQKIYTYSSLLQVPPCMVQYKETAWRPAAMCSIRESIRRLADLTVF